MTYVCVCSSGKELPVPIVFLKVFDRPHYKDTYLPLKKSKNKMSAKTQHGNVSSSSAESVFFTPFYKCFGTAYITMRIRIQDRTKLDLDPNPDPGGKTKK